VQCDEGAALKRFDSRRGAGSLSGGHSP
jgi:hypothetical protein